MDKSKPKTNSKNKDKSPEEPRRSGEKYGVFGHVLDERRRKEQERTKYEIMKDSRPAIAHMRSHKLRRYERCNRWKDGAPKETTSSSSEDKSKDVEKSKDGEKSKGEKSGRGFSSKKIEESEEVSFEMFPPAVVISLCIPAIFIIYYLYTN